MLYEHPTRVEVDLSAIGNNVKFIKSLLPASVKFCAVIKADGYGHGAIAVAYKAISAGANYLAVALIDEAMALRDSGITAPILILGCTPTVHSHKIVINQITQTVFNIEQAKALSVAAVDAGMVTKVHLKIDTGMNRIGITPAEAGEVAKKIVDLPNVQLEGVFTHFANADSADKSHSLKQLQLFNDSLKAISNNGINVAIRHSANTAATLNIPQSHLDMVRIGIGLYGLAPSSVCTNINSLVPAMSLKTQVIMLKEVPAGTAISYGSEYVTSVPSRIATLRIGYADGWNRLLAGKAEVLIGGKRAPIVGRICMDQCMVDVTAIDAVHAGDDVLLFGGADLPVEEVARHLDTINYEVVCMMGKRVPRIYR